MNFYLHLYHAINSLKRAPLLLIVGSLLVSALAVLSLGLLAGPLYGAYQEMVIRMQRDGYQPEPQDLFRGFARFRRFFPVFFLALVLLAAFALYVLPGLILATFWIYALPLMADRGLTLIPALNESASMVKEKGFFKHLLFLLLITIVPSMLLNALGNVIPAISPLLLLVLFLFLAPLQHGCLASLYLANFPKEMVLGFDRPVATAPDSGPEPSA